MSTTSKGLRAAFLALAATALMAAGASCGTSDGSVFGNGGELVDEGGAPPPPGFTPNDGGGSDATVNGCTKLTCQDQGIACGPAGDGCGGKIDDCGKCTGQTTCGGGGTPSQCGGTAGCVPSTCQSLGVECGFAGDGCGGVLDCKTCPAPQVCGGGGPSKCGGGLVLPDGGALLPDGGLCVPRTTCNAGECGPVADGCGGLLTCGGCTGGDTCGGGGVPSQCGQPPCVKRTCAMAGATCGYAADGCGGLLDCGGSMPNAGCAAGQFCGGGGANKCGVGVDSGANCVNFCQDQAACAPGSPTRLTGKVYAPNGSLPIPGAIVYVPNGSKTFPYGVQTFTDGVAAGTCDQCSVQASGPPLVSTTSGFDGSFTLDNVPAGVAFPLVIQLGRWRRLVTIPATTACTTRALTANETRLPTRQAEGNSRDNIPLIAISTGQVDGLECVFRKLGIEDSQFTNPGGTGRIRLYQDDDDNGNTNARGGALIDTSTPSTGNALVNNQANLDQYDAVIFGCPGDQNNRSNAQLDRVRAYANKGGRVFATHFSYVWLYNRAPWNTTIAWDVPNARSSGNGAGAQWTGEIDTTAGKRLLFSQWLGAPGVTALSASAPPRITITEARNNADVPAAAGAEEWIRRHNDPAAPATAALHYTFNTPWGAAPANQCGRVLFSDFHVTIGNTQDVTFPSECNNNALTAQEKVLAFFLFDLTACIEPTTPPPPPTCTPLTCQQQSIGCGLAGNGCGAQIDCGPCPNGQVCQGNPPACVTPTCTPTTCMAAGAECGQIANGCGQALDCGPCTMAGQVCGGAGPNQCGASSCTPTTCQAQGIECGPAGNGCGQLLDCGPCPPGQTCGGGGQNGKCGAPNCTPRTCQQANANCGFVADGCGGLTDCGPCPPGQTCGGGGVPNQCGGGGPGVPK